MSHQNVPENSPSLQAKILSPHNIFILNWFIITPVLENPMNWDQHLEFSRALFCIQHTSANNS